MLPAGYKMATVTDNREMRELPSKWEPKEHEEKLYETWVKKGYFTPDAHSPKPAFSVVLPPPNVTGQLHMGHALDHTLIDSIVRRKRMQGYEVLWLPGMDHAGIGNQTKVEAKPQEEEGKRRWDYERDEFVDKVWEWKEEYGGRILSQMRAIGDSVDWTRERFTMDEGLSRAVQTIFKQMYDEGMIYRDYRLVNWSPVLETAVSDIEVVYKDVEGELVSFRYGSMNDDEPHIVVATTRIETMLGDVAVAVHPDDGRYTDLVGQEFPHPFRDDLTIKVIADDYVDMEFGTGAVKITPAHDPNDYAMGQRHNLDMPIILDSTAHICDTGTRFDGMTREEARHEICEALREQGRIVKEIRPYVHSVGHSERSGEPIEPRLSLQWFVKVDKLAKMAGDAIRDGKTTIHPAALEPRYFDWVDNMHDWTISRQLWWGHRIPIWYGPNDEVVCCGPDDTPPEGYTQDPDVLDTWFSSALFPFSTMGWPDSTDDLKKFYPTSVLVTAYDILFFWVARMMMFGTYAGQMTEGLGEVPFTDLFLHGLVRDERGRKMSKSLGNGINPMDWVEDYGADALRFALARGANPGVDLPLGSDAGSSARNFVTKLFNAARFALSRGADASAELPAELSDADRWILDRLNEVTRDVNELLDDYQFAKANEEMFHFVWDELCDWYLELSKTNFQPAVMGHVLDQVLRLLHPTMPFVTETLWTALTGEETITFAQWPEAAPYDGAEAERRTASRRIADVQKLVTEVRRFRSDQGVKPSQKVPARIDFAAADLAGLEDAVRDIVRLTPPEEDFTPTASIEIRLAEKTVLVEVDTSGTIDVAAEIKRCEKDIAKQDKELEPTGKKLSPAAFLSTAPEAGVEKIKTRREVAQAEKERLTARLAQLEKMQ